jgi:hypothetical protein
MPQSISPEMTLIATVSRCHSSRTPAKPCGIICKPVSRKTLCVPILNFGGVMQAIVIQQDAIGELHDAVVRKPPTVPSQSEWIKLRDMRNLCAGHPANQGYGKSPRKRTYMGRSFGDCIRCITVDDSTGESTVPHFNLCKMIEDYDLEASAILSNVLTKMRQLAAVENASTDHA